MKLIAIETTWFFIIGVAMIVISASIFFFWKEKIPDFFYCNVYTKIFPTEKIPDRCKDEKNKIESITIRYKNEEDAIRMFSSYLLKCWLDAEKYSNLETHYCYKIYFRGPTEIFISQKNISDALIDFDNCRTLQYKSFGCGYRDDIIWSVNKDFIEKDDIVIIKYLNTSQIEIIV
ncbi:MAG: hypothetical protein QXT34_01535 [Candidatus Aenigmatarchaeota archaeon]